MVIDPWDAEMAAHQGRRAIRRGDLPTAERWFKLADRITAIKRREAAIAQDEERRRPIYNPR
ncbi:MAG: hypothetical protein ACT4OF_11340 [Caulobacteraceae bacterium]